MAYQFSATTSFSDETYLESFVESISASLPNEIKRNLDHLRDLDNASCKLLEEWRDNQDTCLRGVEGTLVNVFHAEAANSITGGGDGDGKGGGSDVINITPIKKMMMGSPEKVGSNNNKKRKKSQERSRTTPESPKKVACTKCRAKKVRCDGRQPYCLNRSKEPPSSLDDMLYCSPASSPKKQKVEETTTNNNEDIPTISQEQLTDYLIKRGPPTATEIQTALETYNPQYNTQREEIKSMHSNLRQYSNEKMETANQLKSMIDMALGRLDRDLQKFESELGIDPNVVNVGVAHTHSAELGGGVMTMAGSGGISHHGHGHHQVGGGVHGVVGVHSQHLPSVSLSSLASGFQAASANANNATNLHVSTVASLPPLPSAALQHQHQHSYPSTMRGVIPPKSVQTNNLAAIQVTPNTDWILAKIHSHDKSTKMYTLSDEDVMSNQIYKLPEGKQVVPLKHADRNKWIRGDVCYAVYPDTTSFYRATVSTPNVNGFVMVQFKDDWDVNGITHEKAVLIGHIMKVPVGRK